MNWRDRPQRKPTREKGTGMIRLARPNRQKDRLQLIERALLDQAPRLHRELRCSGQLQTFLENHEAALMEVFEAAEDAAQTRIHQTPTADFQEQVRRLEAAEQSAWKATLEMFLEFSDELPGQHWQWDDPHYDTLSEHEGWPG